MGEHVIFHRLNVFPDDFDGEVIEEQVEADHVEEFFNLRSAVGRSGATAVRYHNHEQHTVIEVRVEDRFLSPCVRGAYGTIHNGPQTTEPRHLQSSYLANFKASIH